MKRIFVDTSGWMMLSDGADRQHRAALRARRDWLSDGGTLVTTSYVADETLTLLRMRLGLEAARRWWESVEASPRLHWEDIDGARAEKARTMFFGWADKRLSFTDCTSFVVMRELRIDLALAADHDFEQAGFRLVPPAR